jgi:hypothetical protein
MVGGRRKRGLPVRAIFRWYHRGCDVGEVLLRWKGVVDLQEIRMKIRMKKQTKTKPKKNEIHMNNK